MHHTHSLHRLNLTLAVLAFVLCLSILPPLARTATAGGSSQPQASTYTARILNNSKQSFTLVTGRALYDCARDGMKEEFLAMDQIEVPTGASLSQQYQVESGCDFTLIELRGRPNGLSRETYTFFLENRTGGNILFSINQEAVKTYLEKGYVRVVQ